MARQLYPYQEKYLVGLPPRVIFHAAAGVGKGAMACAHYQRHASHLPLLILAPAAKANDGSWPQEITEFFGKGNEPQYTIYSYEKFSRNPSAKQLAAGQLPVWWQYTNLANEHAIIADEAKFKNPQSLTGKAVFSIAKNAKFFTVLSATPMANGWIDFANYSKIWGFTKNISEFKRKYCDIVTYKGFPELRGYLRESELLKQWNSISRQLTRAEATELPPKTFIKVHFKKPTEYATMVRTREGADGQLLDSAPALAHALRQTLTKNKLANLSDLISDSHENIVVFYTYKSERAALLDLLAKKHKDTKVYRQDGDVHNVPTKENWGGVNNSVTLAQYQSGSTGIELTYANITVFYSPTYSYSDYVQSIGRTHRNGQTDKTIFYNFITNDTIEFDIQACLSAKQQFVVKLWQPG